MSGYDLETEYSRQIAEIDDETATYAFLENYWEDSINSLKEVLEKENQWTKSTNSTGIGVVYKLFNNFGLLDDNGFADKYKIEASMDELETLEDRLEQHFKNTYDEQELIGIAEAHFDEPITARDLRQNPKTPTETPYTTKFGSIANLNWRLGYEPTQQQYDKEILTEEYLKELHQQNQEYDIHIETPNIGEGSMPSTRSYKNNFENAEEVKERAKTTLIEEMEEELKHWHKITHPNLNVNASNYKGKTNIAQSELLEKTPNDLKPVYPKLEATHPKVENKQQLLD